MAGPGRRRGRAGAAGAPGARSPCVCPPSPAVHGFCHGPRRLGRVSVARLDCRAMIYVCVPAHNEARTVGLVLWKVRQVFTAFPREYQLLVADDASSDGTAAVLASYAKVLPLTIVTHRERRGYARSLEELLRLALQRTDRACASAELLARLAPHARRVDAIPAAARYDLVQRPSRVQPWRQLLAAWQARAVIRAARTVGVALAVCAAALRAQSDSARSDSSPHDSLLQIGAVGPAVPFPVGERLVYQAKFGIFNVRTATIEVAGIDTVRGAAALHLVFRISGGALWYHIEQTLESWVGRSDFRSRRFWNQTAEKGKSWERKFDIYPDSGFYREAGRDTTLATVPDPLDDAAFLYWIRTVPLEVGKRYEYQRYFRPERNPVIVEVLGRERVGVAGRKWKAIVIRPRIPNGGGIFTERADARMWLSDDDHRVMLALQSNFSFGQVTMKLKEYSDPPAGRP